MSGMSDLQDSDPTATDRGFITYFGFRRAPFKGADLNGFYSNQSIEWASATLLEGIRRRAALLVLIGVPGTGKTLLLRKLMQDIPPETEFALCYAANLDFDDLIDFACARLGLSVTETERSSRLEVLNQHLDHLSEQSTCVTLLLDEAHKLPPKTLTRLLDLSATKPSLLLVLSGAPLLERRLAQQQVDHPFVADAVYARLKSFDLDDVAGLIAHRLEVAGKPDPNILFPPQVIERIAHSSEGIPRRILTLADQALHIAYAAREKKVTVAMIDQAEAAPEPQDQERQAENTAVIPLAQNSIQPTEPKSPPQMEGGPTPRRLVLSGILLGALAGGIGILMLYQYGYDDDRTPLAAQTAASQPAPTTPEAAAVTSSSTAAEPSPQPVPEAVPAASAKTSIASYMRSGDRSMERGDIIAARRFYEAAVNAGEAAAAIALGKTYDPVEFSQREIEGLDADPIAAAQWYRKALETNFPEAREHLDRLKLWSEETAELGEAERRILRELVQ